MEHSAGKAPFPLLDLGVGSGFPHGFTGDDNGWWAGLKNWDKTLTTCTLLGQMLGQRTKADEIWIQHQ
jgi:hypothetical protein